MSVSGGGKHAFKKISDGETNISCTFRIQDLNPSSAYYVQVKAENQYGEGYEAEKPTIILTQPATFKSPCRLYVWGSNTNSEIGLTEELVEQNKQHYSKTEKQAILTKPLMHTNF
jgi:hypothetical protein